MVGFLAYFFGTLLISLIFGGIGFSLWLAGWLFLALVGIIGSFASKTRSYHK